MRYGILADIHSNLEALHAALAVLRENGAESFLCLGDIIGYGADPNACCEAVRTLPGLGVQGNHDRAAFDATARYGFNPYARAASEWTERQLTVENRDFLVALPETAAENGFQIVHGSLDDPLFGYITATVSARSSFYRQTAPICFVGHTHIPAAFACREDSVLCAALPFRPAAPLTLKPGFRYVINCGSVGQPRDGNPEAACGLYDTENGTLRVLRVSYDIAAAQAKIIAAGLPNFLAERLADGR